MTWNGGRDESVPEQCAGEIRALQRPLHRIGTTASVFDLGAYEYQTYGGFYGLDDVIDEFTVAGPAIAPDTTPPTVALTAPANGATVSGTVTLTATATDNVAVTGVQFQLDGATLAGTPTVAGSTYTFSWNSKTATNGTHTLAAIASDAAGNTATSSVSVTVANDSTPPDGDDDLANRRLKRYRDGQRVRQCQR